MVQQANQNEQSVPGTSVPGTRYRQSPVIFLERALVESQAFICLTGKAPQVLAIFRTKLQLRKQGRAGKRRWEIVNNGEIVFLYAEARKLGLSNFQFASAVDQLLGHGFLEIIRRGGQHQPTLYGMSDGWRAWRPGDVLAKRTPDRRAHKLAGARAARTKHLNPAAPPDADKTPKAPPRNQDRTKHPSLAADTDKASKASKQA